MRKLSVGLGLCFVTTIISAGPLQIVDVSAPTIDCFFNTNCIINGRDRIAGFVIPHTTGAGRMISRTYVGQPGSPLVGYGAYMYCVQASGIRSGGAEPAAIQSLSIPFSREIIARDYGHTGMTNGQVWVITRGSIGSVKVSSATSFGTNIVFNFNPPIRCAVGTNMGQTSFFFGAVSTNLTRATVGQIQAIVGSNQVSCVVSNTSPVY
jgi:hypothetical protein